MTPSQVTLPRTSWAYPLYDLALIGWIFGAVPAVIQVIAGRAHITAIILGVLCVISLAAVAVGRRDGISVSAYMDSGSRARVHLRDR